VPFTWTLAERTGSAVFQERPLTDIFDTVLGAALPVGAWRYAAEVAQFLESSHNAGHRSFAAYHRERSFLTHHLASEGLVYRYAEDDEAPLKHTLHLLADSGACPEDPTSEALGGIRFHRADATESSDSIQALGDARALQSALTTVLSYDYRSKRAAGAQVHATPGAHGPDAPVLEDYEQLGAYAFDAGSADHYARLRREASECRAQAVQGRSTLRAGTLIRVKGSPLDAALGRQSRLALTAVEHLGINNLPKALGEAIAKRLGAGHALLPCSDPEVRRQAEASGYGNRFEGLPADTPWRPAPPAPRPALTACTATVVGAQGQSRGQGADEIHTDALWRVRVRLHWQQGERANDRSTCWLRVVQAYAGAGMGAHFIPRVGQEVLVSFVEGDVERPVVRGALYNGRGEAGLPPTPGGQAAEADRSALARSHDHAPSSQRNLAGGHSPAWHGAGAAEAAPDAEGQNHRAAMSGFKTQEFGGAGFNQLVFDDTDQQLRVQFATTQHAT